MSKRSVPAFLVVNLMLLAIASILVGGSSAEVREESGNFAEPVADDRFKAGWMDNTYDDSGGNEIEIRLYYPSQSGGENSAIDCAWAPYPWVVFHGDDGEEFDAYSWIGEGLAKSGYFVVVIGEERPSNQIFRVISDHSELIGKVGYINLTGDVEHGPAGASGCIDMDHWGVSGHGVGAALATVANAQWAKVFSGGQFQPPRALFGLGLNTEQTGSEVEASNLAHPAHALFLTGTVDEVAPIDEHAEPLLDQWAGGWQLLEVVGANHVQYEDDQSFFDNLFDGEATMSAEEQQQHALSKIKPYLDLILKGQDESWYDGSSRENNPADPSDPDSYLSENLDGNQFYRMTQSENINLAPVGRQSQTMFYDPLAEQTVLVGGLWGEERYDDFWTLDMTDSGEWESQTEAPSSLGTGAFGFDGEADGLLFGNSDDGSPTLWRWNGWSGTWSAYSNGIRPNGSNGNAMTWDSASGAFLSYGGFDEEFEPLNETWAFDPDIGVWQKLQTQNSPSGVMGSTLFFSDSWNRTFLYGGLDSDWNLTNETWMFNGESNTWSKLALQGANPGARAWMASAMDHERELGYVFGSAWDGGARDLWVFDLVNLTWRQLPTLGTPSRANPGAMAYDAGENKLVLFGGSECGGSACDETWLYDIDNSTWEFYDSSSAVTVTDIIHLESTVFERDLHSAPWNLTVECQVVGETDWVTGNWDSTNDTASCDLSPFALTPGFHDAVLRVSRDGQQATVGYSFKRANAPPQLITPAPTFVLSENGVISVNASDLATDVDGHAVHFITNTLTFMAKDEGDIDPELQWDVLNDWRVLSIEDVSDWSGRSSDSTFVVCGEIRDEGTQGSPPARVPFCFEIVNAWVDDPFIVSENPTFTMEEDGDRTDFDLTPFGWDEEGDPATIHSNNYTSEQETLIRPEANGSLLSFKPALHWYGEESFEICIRHRVSGAECAWMAITLIVTPTPDPPLFNFTEIVMDEDGVYSEPLDEMVWDPDGDELNITLEAGEENVTVELWHEQLRITPNRDWFGRSVNWALVVSDGETEVRQPIRIVVEGVDDPTGVVWSQPDDIENNMTRLRFDVDDPDSSGPWVVEYNWDDGPWAEISPSCAQSSSSNYECQADLLANSLSYGDHELNLRVNDGDAISDIRTFWLEKADPNSADPTSSDSQSAIPASALIVGGLVLLVIAGAAILALLRQQEE